MPECFVAGLFPGSVIESEAKFVGAVFLFVLFEDFLSQIFYFEVFEVFTGENFGVIDLRFFWISSLTNFLRSLKKSWWYSQS